LLKKDLRNGSEKDFQILLQKGFEGWISDPWKKDLRIGSTNPFERIWSALPRLLLSYSNNDNF